MEARVRATTEPNLVTRHDDNKEARVRDLRERERIFLKLTRVEVEVCFLFLRRVECLTI